MQGTWAGTTYDEKFTVLHLRLESRALGGVDLRPLFGLASTKVPMYIPSLYESSTVSNLTACVVPLAETAATAGRQKSAKFLRPGEGHPGNLHHRLEYSRGLTLLNNSKQKRGRSLAGKLLRQRLMAARGSASASPTLRGWQPHSTMPGSSMKK